MRIQWEGAIRPVGALPGPSDRGWCTRHEPGSRRLQKHEGALHPASIFQISILIPVSLDHVEKGKPPQNTGEVQAEGRVAGDSTGGWAQHRWLGGAGSGLCTFSSDSVDASGAPRAPRWEEPEWSSAPVLSRLRDAGVPECWVPLIQRPEPCLAVLPS